MKNILFRIFIIAGLIICSTALSYAPPPPPGDHGSGGNVPAGGGAPIGGGLALFFGLGSAWAGRKLYQAFNNQTHKSKPE